MVVGYVYDPFMSRHECDEDHPECPDRIHEIYKELLNRGLIQKMVPIKSRLITKDELYITHSKDYIDSIFNILNMDKLERDKHIHFIKRYGDIFANNYTLECARLAAGSTLDLVKSVVKGEIESGVSIVRPPGHHASWNKPSGFCIFNNVAIAANYCLIEGLKVAIVDYDVHFGDGTADIFKHKEQIEFFSIHRYDKGNYYPGTGKTSKVKNIHNYGLNSIGDDQKYINLFSKQIIPKLEEFCPDIILVSSGFDAGINDPLGNYKVTPQGFRAMVKLIKGINSKIVLVLEGGYNLITISKSMAECTEELISI